VRGMAAAGARTLVELGPGKVLSGLARRIDKALQLLPIDGLRSLGETVEVLSRTTGPAA